MTNLSTIFLPILLVGILIIALILTLKVILAEIRKPSNEQLLLFSILGIIIVFLIPLILSLIQIL